MALLFTDGFDWWDDADDAFMYNNNSGNPRIVTDVPRRHAISTNKIWENYNQNSGRLIARFLPYPENRDELIVGYMFRQEARISNDLPYGICLYNDSDVQCGWRFYRDWSLQFFRGNKSAEIWRSNPGLMHPYAWQHIEARIRIDNTTGEYEFRINGEPIVNASGVDTQFGTEGGACRIIIGNHEDAYCQIDDFYILDTLGGVNDDFLGPAPYINTIWPSSAGTHTDWEPSAGSNWDTVDDADDVDTSDYIQVSGDYLVDGAKDTYTYEDLENWNDSLLGLTINHVDLEYTSSGEVLAVMETETEFTNSGENVIWDYVKDYEGAHRRKHIWDKNPSGEITWTESFINAAEFGIKWNSP